MQKLIRHIAPHRNDIITSFVLVWRRFHSRLIHTASGRLRVASGRCPYGSGRLLVGPEVSDAWPVRCQTYGYLPSRRASPPVDWYKILLLGDKVTTE